MQVVLELSRRRNPSQNVALFLHRKIELPVYALQVLLDPALFVGCGDVGQLGTDGLAVGLFEEVSDLAKRGFRVHEYRSRIEALIQVLVAEAVMRKTQLGHFWTLVKVDRIEIGFAVTPIAIGADEFEYLYLLRSECGARLDVHDVAAVGAHRQIRVTKIGEVAAPRGIDILGIVQVALVERIEELCVPGEKRGTVRHGLILTVAVSLAACDRGESVNSVLSRLVFFCGTVSV
jgi:hypothetical protein